MWAVLSSGGQYLPVLLYGSIGQHWIGMALARTLYGIEARSTLDFALVVTFWGGLGEVKRDIA